MGMDSNERRIRMESGHAWNLKGKCRFCGMDRAFFKLNARPECPWSKPKTKNPSSKTQPKRPS
jgi:hypothetical protein